MSASRFRILCVDDDPQILEGIENTLWLHDLVTATSGAAGLERLHQDGPFAVAISDMRMPGMDGATFLGHVRRQAPDVVRVLLTGHADLDAAISAINEGGIFRFLMKPCNPDHLIRSVDDAIAQYRLIVAERELLQDTFTGALRVLTSVLDLASPSAAARASHARAYVAHLAASLDLERPWQYEVAAMLSQLGCVSLPGDTLDRVYAGQVLSASERSMMESHPLIASELLAEIPRLDVVAEIIRNQDRSKALPSQIPPDKTEDEITLGSAMLRLALAVDREVARGSSLTVAVSKMRSAGHPALLCDALRKYQEPSRLFVLESVDVQGLRRGMVLDEDVRSMQGPVVIGRGRVLDVVLLARIRNYHLQTGIAEPIRVRMPTAQHLDSLRMQRF